MIENKLDEICRELNAPGDVPRLLPALAARLRALKQTQPPELWEQTVATCRAHPLRAALHEDPLTARAFNKPRGYQGDAELLDIIYTRDYRGIWREPVSRLGDELFRYTIECQAPDAVRLRRDFLARRIDDLCAKNSAATILSMACGHLREATLSRAVRERRFGRFIGLDQDADSLRVVADTVGRFGVEALAGSVKSILAGVLDGQRFDFVYTAGLYDYLGDRLAQRLTAKLFDRLEPGGRLLIANYLPDIPDVGYMEAYMGWELIYRDETAMAQLAGEIPPERIAASRVFPEARNTIAFLELQKIAT